MEIPKGIKHPRLAHLPEIESFAKTEGKKKVLTVWRAFRASARLTSCLREHPKTRVEILEEAMRRAFKDPEVPKVLQETGRRRSFAIGSSRIGPADQGMPREAEILELVKKFSGAGPLPPR